MYKQIRLPEHWPDWDYLTMLVVYYSLKSYMDCLYHIRSWAFSLKYLDLSEFHKISLENSRIIVQSFIMGFADEGFASLWNGLVWICMEVA